MFTLNVKNIFSFLPSLEEDKRIDTSSEIEFVGAGSSRVHVSINIHKPLSGEQKLISMVQRELLDTNTLWTIDIFFLDKKPATIDKFMLPL